MFSINKNITEIFFFILTIFSGFFTGIKWLPVAFILAVISWSYYAFVYVVCFLAVESMVERVIFLFLYHLILILFIWSYLKTIFAPKCETPPSWKLSKAMSERLVQVRYFHDFFLAKKFEIIEEKIMKVLKFISF